MSAPVKSRAVKSILAALLAALVLHPATAQTSTPQTPAVFVLNSPLLSPEGKGTARIYINDAAGQPLAGLKSEDLTVRFNGKPVVGKVDIEQMNDVPLQVVLGLDVSLWNPQDAAYTSALTQTVQQARDVIAVDRNARFAAFPFSTTVTTPLASDVRWLQNSHVWQGKSTDLYGAINQAAKTLSGYDTQAGRNALVLITNSGNTANTSLAYARGTFTGTAASAVAGVHQANSPVFIFAVEERNRPFLPKQRNELIALARATGGALTVIPYTALSTLPSVVSATLSRLRGGYEVTFNSGARVDQDNTLEIGLTPARMNSISVPAQSAIETNFQVRAMQAPSDVVSLAADPRWNDEDIRSMTIFVDGKPAKTLTQPPFAFKLGDLQVLKDQILIRAPGSQIELTATLQLDVNDVIVAPLTLTVPMTTSLELLPATKSGQPITLLAEDAITFTQKGAGVMPVNLIVTDRQDRSFQLGNNVLSLPGSLLSPGQQYWVRAESLDEWDRPMASAPIALKVEAVNWPRVLGSALLIVLLLVLIGVLIAWWLGARERRRQAARVVARYRLVNHSNGATAFVVLADYAAQDLRLKLGVDQGRNAPARNALPNAEGKLLLITPEIEPGEEIMLHVTVEPVRLGALDVYDFRLLTRAKKQDPSLAQARAFKLRPRQ